MQRPPGPSAQHAHEPSEAPTAAAHLRPGTSLTRHNRFFWLSREMLCVIDPSGRMLDANPAFVQGAVPPGLELRGRHLAELLNPEDRPLALIGLARLSGEGRTRFDARGVVHSSTHWMQWSISLDHDANLAYVVARDVTARKIAETHLTLLSAALEQSAEAVLITDADLEAPGPQIIYVNPAFCQLSGYSEAELVGRSPRILQGPETDRALTETLRHALNDGKSFISELINYRKDGSAYRVECQITPITDAAGRISHYLSLQRDVSEQRRREALLDYQAHYDLVTGLPNRVCFNDRMEEAIAAARAAGRPFALCVIDLDRFSRINDTLSHRAGDDVLAAVAQRLRQLVPPGDTLARMGGDEFTLIMADAPDEAAALSMAGRLLGALEAPFYADGHELFVSASVGLSLFPRDGEDVGTLLKHADSAMYRAKAHGRNSVSIFEPAIGRAARARLTLDTQIRRAIDGGQFGLYYQPQLDLRSNTVVGVESLIRWHHPERGLLSPNEFIAAAEESHLMSRVADWVIVESCAQAVAWQRAGRPPIRVAVNLSARQFEEGDIIGRTAAALARTGLDPACLDLEITESMLMRDPEGSAVRVEQLRALGVRVSIDDFGTGYSSLAYLQKFPVDALKIDRSFVWGLNPQGQRGNNGAALVQAIVALAHSLGLDVVAEGVETLDQHMLLRAIGCDEVQGYLYARPMPADKVWDIIRDLMR